MQQQPLDRPADDGVTHLRRDLRGRLQHERPKRHPRMRQREHRRFAHFVAVEQQVDIERPRRPALAALRPCRASMLLQLG